MFSAIVVVQVVTVAKAEDLPSGPEIIVLSPSNKTYIVNSITLDIAVVCYFDFLNGTENRRITYSLDGGKEGFLMPLSFQEYEYAYTRVSGQTVLSGLTEGPHSVAIRAEYNYSAWHPNWTMSDTKTVFFEVDTLPPRILISSLNGETFSSANVPLNVTVSEPFSWMAYSLDGRANVTLNGNTTLTGLSEGSHSVIVYANDTVGNMGSSQTNYFTINQETQQQTEHFPTALIVIAALSVAIVSLSLLVYWKKRKPSG